MRPRLFIVALLWVFLPLQALGDDLVIPTEPARVDIPDVKFYRLSYAFQEDEPGRLHLQVNLRYRPWVSDIERVEHFTFRLQSGSIVQRGDQTLVLRLDNREMVVGRHRWWYDPYWQPADDVRIACDPKRQRRGLIIENCRLVVEKPAFGERNGLVYPAAEGTSFTREIIAVGAVTTSLRNQLELGLSGTEPVEGIVARIMDLRAAHTVEAAPARTLRAATAEEPVTTRIRQRARPQPQPAPPEEAGASAPQTSQSPLATLFNLPPQAKPQHPRARRSQPRNKHEFSVVCYERRIAHLRAKRRDCKSLWHRIGYSALPI